MGVCIKKSELFVIENDDLYFCLFNLYTGRAKRIWYLSHMRAAKVQASLRIRAVSPEPPLLAHTSSESRGTFRQKARSLAPLNGWACAVKICHDGMLEDTNSLGGAHTKSIRCYCLSFCIKASFRLRVVNVYRICYPFHDNVLVLNGMLFVLLLKRNHCLKWQAEVRIAMT